MTSTPEPTPAATTPAAPTPSAETPQAVPDAAGRPVLDEATFPHLIEPRSAHRLPSGDGPWHQLARAYVWVRLISLILLVLVIAAGTVTVALAAQAPWVWLPGGILTLIFVFTAAITPRQARSFGYRLREDDLLFRRGILWQRMVAVPYGRMQLVDISHGPLDRAFGIAKLKLITAAASTGVEIPGLTQKAAEELRDALIEVAETRRTGL